MTNVQLEQLLKHESFLRGLARSLLRDSARADDVVQEAWLVALRSSKRPDEVQRGWLAGIVRNLVRRVRRDDARRARRERIAARGGTERPADEVVADRLLSRRIAELVLALPEHYREPLLLRYFDGLEPQAIGQRLAMSSSTVRTRLQRGLQRVRAQLVEQRTGSARALGLALIPLACPRPVWRVPRGIAAAVLVGATAALWLGVVPALQRTVSARSDVVARADIDRAHAALVTEDGAAAAAASADERPPGSVLWLVRVRAPRGVFTSAVDLVVSAEGAPHRVVRRVEAGVRASIVLDKLLEAGRPARLTIEARHPECLPRTQEVTVPADHVVQPLDLSLVRRPLVPAESLRIEDRGLRAALASGAGTAKPSTSAAATIELLFAGLREPSSRLVGIVHAPDDGPVMLRVCRSDGRGVCLRGSVPAGRFFAVSVDALFAGALPAALTVEASHAAAAPASLDVPVLVDTATGEPVLAPFELTLAAGRRIEGRVLAGEPIEGATVAVFAMEADQPEPTPLAAGVTDKAGTYAFTVESVGPVLVVAAVAGRAPAGHLVTIDAAEETPVAVPDHELPAGAAIDGRVVDDNGRGLEASLRAESLATSGVVLTFTPGVAAVAYHGGDLAWQQASARADADGVYRIAGLAEGEHELTLAAEPDPLSRVVAAPGLADFVLPSARVEVLVRGADGAPLAGARVALGTSVAFTDAAGYAPFAAPPGVARDLLVTHDDHADATRSVTAPARGAALTVQVTLEPVSPLATLVVTVRGATAGPVPAAFGFLLLSPRVLRPKTVLATMEAGRFVLHDLRPGLCLVSAYPGGPAPPPTNYYLPASASVTLTAGSTTELALDVAVGGRLDIAVPDGATVWLGEARFAPARLSHLAHARQHSFGEPFEGERASSRWRSPLLEPGRYDVALIPWDRRQAAAQLVVDVLAGRTVRR